MGTVEIVILAFTSGVVLMGLLVHIFSWAEPGSKDIDFIERVYLRFTKFNPYNATSNYTCLPRAQDFQRLTQLLGYDSTIQVGCDGELNLSSTKCHAWVSITTDYLGSPLDFPFALNSTQE